MAFGRMTSPTSRSKHSIPVEHATYWTLVGNSRKIYHCGFYCTFLSDSFRSQGLYRIKYEHHRVTLSLLNRTFSLTVMCTQSRQSYITTCFLIIKPT